MTSSDKNYAAEQAAASDDSIQQVHANLQSNKPDRPEGYSKTPLILLGIMCCAIFFGSIYVAHYSIRFDPHVVSEHANRAVPGKSEAPTVTPAMLGKRVFSTTCFACHQTNGQGQPGIYPPLAGSEWAQGDPHRIIRIVLHGLSGPITVEGKQFNNVMAPLGAALTDEQIANVLTYVRQEWGNSAPPVDVETVKQVRAETQGRTAPWTVEELEKIAPEKS